MFNMEKCLQLHLLAKGLECNLDQCYRPWSTTDDRAVPSCSPDHKYNIGYLLPPSVGSEPTHVDKSKIVIAEFNPIINHNILNP